MAGAPSRIEVIELVVAWLFERIEPFANDHMTGRASTVEFAGVLHLDAVSNHGAREILARRRIKDSALRTGFRPWNKERHLGPR